MKKSLLAAAVIFSVISSTTYAQSSATLYGMIDTGLLYTSNAIVSPGVGKPQLSVASGVIQGSRWGFRIVEDLGGQQKVIAVLENGFDPDTGKLGQGGLEFGRQAYIGLSDGMGTLTLGRQYNPMTDYLGLFAASGQWGGYLAEHPGDLDNFNYSIRTNNSIKYVSPDIDGFSLRAMYAVGGVAGNITQNQQVSVGTGYTKGPLTLAVGYLDVRNPNVSFFGSSTSGTPSDALANSASPVFSGYASAHTYQVIAAGGAYNLGAATIGATYSNIQFRGLGDISSGPNPSGYSGNAIFNNAEVNFKYLFAPSLTVGVAYDYNRGSAVDANPGATYHQASIGVDYFVSIRTDLYFIGTYQKALGTESTGAPAQAYVGLTASSNDHAAAVRLGIRHRF